MELPSFPVIRQYEGMTDACSGPVPKPQGSHGRWSSFVAAEAAPGLKSRGLHEQEHPRHRVRVEHDNHTLLVHISDEEGKGWTTIALDRPSRAWSVSQRESQLDAATSAYENLYIDRPAT